MVKKQKNEASNLASSRASRSRLVKKKTGVQAQQEFTRKLKELTRGLNITIQCEGETNAFSDFGKFLEKEINKKRLN